MTLSISIITPSFNQAVFLPQCLQSVADQSHPALEHLVYDPGSKDNSRDIACSYPHVTLISEPDQGQSDAVSKGFLKAKGDVIGWLNSDDCYSSPDIFAHVIQRFKQPDFPDIVYGRGVYVDDQGKYLRDAYVNESPETLEWKLHKEVGILQPALFLRRSVIEKIGVLSNALNFCMDYEYWIRAVKAGLKFAFLPEVLAFARYYKDNKTLGKRGESLREICDTVKSHFGYVHVQWIRNYAEFLSEGFDGILANSSNQKVTNQDAIDYHTKHLLKAYNTDYYTLKLLIKNYNNRPYNLTVEAMKNHKIGLDFFYHEIPLEQKTEPNSYCYTVGDKRWAFSRQWKDTQIEKTKKTFEKFHTERVKDTCIIVGNGPSLNKTDLSLLENQDVFISNYAFLNPNLIKYAKYIAVTNYLVAEQGSHQFNLLENVRKLFPYWLGYCINEDDNTFFFNSVGYAEFSKDINTNVSWRSTVSFFQMQIAYWLGYKRVLLIGFDHSYDQKSSAQEGDILLCDEDDKNHFDPRYFKGKLWQAADVKNMEAMYLLVKQAFEEDSRDIVNCTVGGYLDVFRRSDLKVELKQMKSNFIKCSYDYIKEANHLMDQEYWSQAIDLYRQGIKINPNQPAIIYEKLGECLMFQNYLNTVFEKRSGNFQNIEEYKQAVLNHWEQGIQIDKPEDLSWQETTLFPSQNKGWSDQEMSEFPRVLVLSKIKFNQQAGGGVTMGNLFRGWPIDKIAQIHTDKATEADLSVCRNYLYVPYPPTQLLGNQQAHNQEEFLPKYIFPWEKILNWCSKFSPDIIYARPMDDPSFYWWLPIELSKQLNIPYVTHIMDDWPARYERREELESDVLWKPRLRKYLQSLFDHAQANIGISKEMCVAYQERYRHEFVPFHNCIDVSEWSGIQKSYEIKKEFTLLYIGAVTPDKELGGLQDIRDVVLSLNRRGYSIRLGIYSARFWKKTVQESLENLPEIGYRGYVNPSELPEILSQADLLVLPINFDEASLAYVGYSLQTKVPEYMASGTPVLVYGPSNSPNIRYAKTENWGVVVDKRDKIQLENAIIQLIEQQDLREKIGRYARDLAFQNHNAVIVRNKFRRLLHDSIVTFS